MRGMQFGYASVTGMLGYAVWVCECDRYARVCVGMRVEYANVSGMLPYACSMRACDGENGMLVVCKGMQRYGK